MTSSEPFNVEGDGIIVADEACRPDNLSRCRETLMHVGLCTGFSNDVKLDNAQFMKEELKLILIGEELGYDPVRMTEDHFDDHSISPAPLMTLFWIAAQTAQTWLGTAVIVGDPLR